MDKRVKELQQQIDALEKQIKADNLLRDIWSELGPYTPHLTNGLRYRLQDHFEFDDSE